MHTPEFGKHSKPETVFTPEDGLLGVYQCSTAAYTKI